MNRPRPTRHPAADRGGMIDWSAVRRILVVRMDNLGDVVMLTPALRTLRTAVPHARVDLLASPAGAAAAPMLPGITRVLTESVVWQQVDPPDDTPALALGELALVRRVSQGDYDVLLVFTSPTQSPWPAAHVGLLAGIPVRAVHSTEFGGAVATHWVTPPPDGTHQVDRCLHLLESLGLPPAGRALELRFPAVPGLPRRFALLAPGASCSSKRYPPERFATVARLLAASGLEVLVTGSDREHDLVWSVVDGAASPGVSALEGLDVPGLAGAVAQADVVLCNNSACMHLADAARTPVVVTYAGTERLSDMQPRSTTATLLHNGVSCSPCRQFRCPYDQECLDIDPEDVASAALRLVTTREVCPL